MRRLAIIETYWYFAFQDGPADNVKYPTEKEAKEAFKKLRSSEKRGICIMSCTHEVEP